MFFPLGTDQSLKRPTVVTYWLIGLNIAVFVFGGIYGSPRVAPEAWARVYESFWLDPNAPRAWQWVSYQFLHGGFLHILFMLVLFVFGPPVEDRLRRAGFLAFYLVGGAAAGAAHALLERPIGGPGGYVPPVVGASGSIAAVTGAFLVLFPLTNIRVFSVFFVIGAFSLPSWIVIGMAMANDLVFEGFGSSERVARLAHIGGYLYGAAVALFLLWTKVLARQPYDLFSMGRQLHRRRQFRELVAQGNTAWSNEVGAKAKVKRGEKRSGKSKDEERAARLSERRSEVTRAIGEGDLGRGADLYSAACEEFGEVVLPRQAQLDLANFCFKEGRHALAAGVYEAFLRKHPSDSQTPHVRMMLAVLSARYLNDPLRAQTLIDELRRAGVPDDHREILNELEQELG